MLFRPQSGEIVGKARKFTIFGSTGVVAYKARGKVVTLNSGGTLEPGTIGVPGTSTAITGNLTYDQSVISPRKMACTVACVLVAGPSFLFALSTWASTVRRPHLKMSAVSSAVLPSAAHFSTSSSRSLKSADTRASSDRSSRRELSYSGCRAINLSTAYKTNMDSSYLLRLRQLRKSGMLSFHQKPQKNLNSAEQVAMNAYRQAFQHAEFAHRIHYSCGVGFHVSGCFESVRPAQLNGKFVRLANVSAGSTARSFSAA